MRGEGGHQIAVEGWGQELAQTAVIVCMRMRIGAPTCSGGAAFSPCLRPGSGAHISSLREGWGGGAEVWGRTSAWHTCSAHILNVTRRRA